MTQVPGARQWESNLVGHTLHADYPDRNFWMGGWQDQDGVITFHDGTLWVYSMFMPAGGIQSGEWDGVGTPSALREIVTQDTDGNPGYEGWNRFSYGGVTILELKPGAEIWERLTPDDWGLARDETQSEWPEQPNITNFSNWNVDGDVTGDLANHRLSWSGPIDPDHFVNGTYEEPYRWHGVHSGLKGDDFVYFYMRGMDTGVFRVSKENRTWERFIFDYSATPFTGQLGNMVINGEYLWFMSRDVPGTSTNLVRVPLGDLGSPEVVHTWTIDPTTNFGTYFAPLPEGNSVFKTKEEFEARINRPYLYQANVRSMGVDDGWLYLFEVGNVSDQRNRGLGNPPKINYDIKFSMLRRCRIGSADFELLYYSRTPDGFVGSDENGLYGAQTISSSDLEVGVHVGKDVAWPADYPLLGLGFVPSRYGDVHIRDDWLYFLDESLANGKAGSYNYEHYQWQGPALSFARLFLPDLISDGVLSVSVNGKHDENTPSAWVGSSWSQKSPSQGPDEAFHGYRYVTNGLYTIDDYLAVDTRAPIYVDSVGLVNGDANYWNQYSIDIMSSDDGITWTKRGDFFAQGQGTYLSGIPRTKAQYWKFQSTGTSVTKHWSIDEMDLYGPTLPGIASPQRHDPLNPKVEYMTNATSPWDGFMAWGGGDPSTDERHHYREGTEPLHGECGTGFMLAEDGSIAFCHDTYPSYTSFVGTFMDQFQFGDHFQPLAMKTVSRLSPPVSLKTDITVTFTGTSLKGYSNIRQMPTSSEGKTLELK